MSDDVVARSAAAVSALQRTASEIAKAPIDPVAWQRGTIVFSACNEDSLSEIRAFGSLEGKRVLCVTAGGGRVLNLLARMPKFVCAVDLNPAQNALLELKIAGMRALDHTGYLEFLGVRPAARDRAATYERLRPRLSDGAQGFFDANLALIQDGVLMQGKLERFLRRLAKVVRLGHPLGLSQLFSFEDIAQQRAFMTRWDTLLWRTLAQNLARRWVMQVFSGDPGFYRYVPEHIPLHRAIYDRVHQYFWNHLARENALLQLVFFGRYVYEPALPIYLNAATYERTRAALERVQIETITARVDDALEYGASEPFDAFSLSDISSYLDDEAHARLFERVLRAARPGAALCSRSNIHHRPLQAQQARRIERDTALEHQLAVDDHSCVHEFLVGKIS
jgi:S-adenosylmethionine-diacylglycerol 3-amino-3-carboxypropyl transferase